jgi:hypothetical protein
MKQIKLHQWLIAGALLLLAASCSRNNYPTDRRPRDKDVIYRPDGTIIIVPRGTGTEGMPPGQQKKVYGQRSAKVFAPGQRRKHGNNCGNNRSRKHKHRDNDDD